jgi:hypothetical protein
MGQEYQHQAERVGQQFQKAAETGVSSILRSWGELNRGWTAMAAEVNEYSKTVFSNATRTMEQLTGAKTFEDVVEIQSKYTKKAYDNPFLARSGMRICQCRKTTGRLSPRAPSQPEMS